MPSLSTADSTQRADTEGSPLTAVLVTGPTKGGLSLAANAGFTYTPNANATGADSFTYRANDGAANSNIATVNLTVNAVNDAPTANAGGPYTGSRNVPVAFSGSGNDPEGAALTYSWTFGDSTTGTGPSPTHTYTASGTYIVTLTVNDGALSSVPSTTTATIAATQLYLSLEQDGIVGTLPYANEDVLAFDGTNFTMHFDGSDVGLSGFIIDAFAVTGPNEVLLSFTAAGAIPGVAGTTDDSDVVRFTATSLGPNTAGTFSRYFDGSDVGLTTEAEDVDGPEVLADGRVVISTFGDATVTGVSSPRAEDLLAFTPTSLGATTAGTWAMYFDAGDVGLSTNAENVDAVAVGADGKIQLSTTGAFAVTGVSGSAEDAFTFTPTSLGTSTAGTYSSTLKFDGSAYGMSGRNLSGIDLA